MNFKKAINTSLALVEKDYVISIQLRFPIHQSTTSSISYCQILLASQFHKGTQVPHLRRHRGGQNQAVSPVPAHPCSHDLISHLNGMDFSIHAMNSFWINHQPDCEQFPSKLLSTKEVVPIAPFALYIYLVGWFECYLSQSVILKWSGEYSICLFFSCSLLSLTKPTPVDCQWLECYLKLQGKRSILFPTFPCNINTVNTSN